LDGGNSHLPVVIPRVDLTIDEDEIARQLSPEIMKTWINLPPPESKAIV
jgi:hypothetical protein